MRKTPLFAALTLAACAHGPVRNAPKQPVNTEPSLAELCADSKEILYAALAAPGDPDFCRKVSFMDAAAQIACGKDPLAASLHDQAELAQLAKCPEEGLDKSGTELECVGATVGMADALLEVEDTCNIQAAREAEAAMDKACEGETDDFIRRTIAEFKAALKALWRKCVRKGKAHEA